MNCALCGKPIKGEMVFISVSRLAQELGLARERAYHPKCFERAPESEKVEIERQRDQNLEASGFNYWA